MSQYHDIAAIALLTREDVVRLGTSFKLVFKVDDEPRFAGLIAALDRADEDSRARPPGMHH